MRCILYMVLCINFIYTQEYPYKNITTNDGLPSSEVYSVIQDSKGYIWCSTDAGVAKYDGKSFDVFSSNDGLPYNTVFNLHEDSRGWIWGSCYNGSIFYIHHDSVHTIRANNKLVTILENGKSLPLNIKVDKLNTLWIASTRGCIKVPSPYYTAELIKPKDECDYFTYVIVNISGSMLGYREYTNQIKKDIYPRAKLKVYLNNAKVEYDGFIKYYRPFIRAINFNNKILFAIEKEVFIFEKNKIVSILKTESTINCIHPFKDEVFVGTSKNGFFLFDINSRKVVLNNLSGVNISAFYQDYENGLWVSTLTDGLFYVPNPSILVESSMNLKSQNILGLEMIDNELYINTTKNNELIKVDSYHTKSILNSENSNSSISQTHLFKNKDLLYVFNSSSYIYNLRTKQKIYILRSNNKTTFNSFCIQRDSLFVIDRQWLNLIIDSKPTKIKELPARGQTCFSYKNQIYVGTIAGLYLYTNQKFDEIRFSENDSIPSKVSHMSNFRNQLVVCTQNRGVFYKNQNAWISINTTNGLSSNLVNHFLSIGDSLIILSTNKGIDIFQIKNNGLLKLNSINQSDGLLNLEVIKTVFWMNKLWIGTKKGLYIYDIMNDLQKYAKPFLWIKSMYVNNQKINNLLNLKSYQNNFQFDFDILSYKDIKKNELYYQLLPRDKNFIKSSSSIILLENLPPDTYELRVKAKNNRGVDSELKVIVFTVPPAWYKTNLFYLACFALFILLVYFIAVARIRFVINRNKIQLNLEKQISDLQASALRSQMNPHFIFNVLNSIQHYILVGNNNEANVYLSKFSKLVRKVLNNSRAEYISLEEEIITLRLFIELEQMRFENKFKFQINIDNQLTMKTYFIPVMIIQPFVENAIWHGIMKLKDRSGELLIDLKLEKDKLKVEIVDNGVGLNSNTKKHSKENESLGTEIVKQRLSKYGDAFYFTYDTSTNNLGTKVLIYIPITKQ